jgi:hypothetical protein
MGSKDGLLPPVPVAPEDAVVIHIGVHKTGTTAIQAALANSRSDLEKHGVRYPGRRQAHHAAAIAVIGKTWGWSGKGGVQKDRESFERLGRQIAAHPGRVIVSSEHWCESPDEVAQETVMALGASRVQVAITVRNVGNLLSSSYQQYLKYGLRARYEPWLENLFAKDDGSRMSPSFWLRNHHDVVVERWAKAVGPDRVTVIVLEDVQRQAMFVAFAQMLGIPQEILTSRMDLTSNRSMTAQEAELLRRVNVGVKNEMTWTQYERLVRYGVARTIVEGRDPAPGEPKIATPDWALDAAAERGARAAKRIGELGVTVIGSLDALAARIPSQPAIDPNAVTSLPMDVAVTAIETLVLAAKEIPVATPPKAQGWIRGVRSFVHRLRERARAMLGSTASAKAGRASSAGTASSPKRSADSMSAQSSP